MAEQWWSVLVEMAGADGVVGSADLDRLLDELAAKGVSPAVAGAGGRCSARVSVAAPTADAAARGAAEVVTVAARSAALPPWPVVRLEALTEEELEAELARPPLPELVGVAEAAEILGVSKTRIGELVRTNESFPRPIVSLAATPVWMRPAIESFLEQWERKPGRPARAAPAAATPEETLEAFRKRLDAARAGGGGISDLEAVIIAGGLGLLVLWGWLEKREAEGRPVLVPAASPPDEEPPEQLAAVLTFIEKRAKRGATPAKIGELAGLPPDQAAAVENRLTLGEVV